MGMVTEKKLFKNLAFYLENSNDEEIGLNYDPMRKIKVPYTYFHGYNFNYLVSFWMEDNFSVFRILGSKFNKENKLETSEYDLKIDFSTEFIPFSIPEDLHFEIAKRLIDFNCYDL